METKLRPFTYSDAESLVRYANNWNVAKNLRDVFPHPYQRDDAQRFIEQATRDRPIHIFAIDLEGEAIGGIGIYPQTDIYRKNAELGYWLAEPYWGKGIMTSLIGEAVNFAFSTFDIDRVYAIPFGSNIASQKVLEKNGFSLEARLIGVLIKNGLREDELIYAVRQNISLLQSPN